MGRRRHLSGVRQGFQDRLLGWAMDGNRKSMFGLYLRFHLSFLACVLIPYIYLKSFHFWFWEISFFFFHDIYFGAVLDELNLIELATSFYLGKNSEYVGL